MTVPVLVGVYTVLCLGVTVWLCRGLKFSTGYMALGGLTCALTMILESIMIPLPTGASITCGSWIPLMVLAIVCDYRLAFVSGWLCGLLAIILVPSWQPMHWAQIFVEHMVCFSCLGYTGVFGTDSRKKILCGGILAMFIKFWAHVFSGVVFFSQNAWDGWGAWGYSLAYHLSSTLPEEIFSLIIIMLLPISTLKKAEKGVMHT